MNPSQTSRVLSPVKMPLPVIQIPATVLSAHELALASGDWLVAYRQAGYVMLISIVAIAGALFFPATSSLWFTYLAVLVVFTPILVMSTVIMMVAWWRLRRSAAPCGGIYRMKLGALLYQTLETYDAARAACEELDEHNFCRRKVLLAGGFLRDAADWFSQRPDRDGDAATVLRLGRGCLKEAGAFPRRSNGVA